MSRRAYQTYPMQLHLSGSGDLSGALRRGRRPPLRWACVCAVWYVQAREGVQITGTQAEPTPEVDMHSCSLLLGARLGRSIRLHTSILSLMWKSSCKRTRGRPCSGVRSTQGHPRAGITSVRTDTLLVDHAVRRAAQTGGKRTSRAVSVALKDLNLPP